MTQATARELASFVRQETACEAYATLSPLGREYVVAVESDADLILLQGWMDWHAHKENLLALRERAYA